MRRMPTPRRMVSSGRAAAELGVHQRTLWAWVTKGLVAPHAKTAGGQMRWDLERLQREIEALTNVTEESHVPEPADRPERQAVVAAIVTSSLGVLVGRRNDGKPPWTFIAGEIEPGESQTDAAVREVKEETGLQVHAGRQEIGRRVHPATGRTMIYLACTPTEPADIHHVFVGDTDELAEVRWLTLAEVDEKMGKSKIYPPVREHLARMLEA